MRRSRGKRPREWRAGSLTIFRLSLVLSFASHAAALAFAAWLGGRPPAIPEAPTPQTIPLIFIEPSAPPDQTSPATLATGASEPTAAQAPSPPVEQPAPAEPPAEASLPPPPSNPAPDRLSKPASPAETSQSSANETVSAPHASETPTASPSPPARHATTKLTAKKSGPAPAAKQVRREMPTLPPPPTATERRDTSRMARSMPSTASHPSDTAAASQAYRQPAHPPASQAYPSPAYPPASQAYRSQADPRGSQLATVAAPRPAPPAASTQAIGAEYRSALSTWLERHKIYPEAARQRGEEGSAVLHFRVDRYGRVLTYQLTQSTGFAELDAAIDQMMRGAALPPFPAGMTQPEIAVSVPIRFSLNR